MWEAQGLENDDMLWAGTNFFGGMCRHREGVCGAVSAMAISLGMMHRCPPGDDAAATTAREKARERTSALVQRFKDTHGSIVCRELLGITSMTDEEITRFFEEKRHSEQCSGYVRYIVEKLFEYGGRADGA